jgi:hypothetical protein
MSYPEHEVASGGDRRWFEHLSERDLSFVARMAPLAGVDSEHAQRHPEALSRVLSHPSVFDAVFVEADAVPWLHVSPFLVFALAVHRGWAELQVARHVDEWIAPRQRIPVLGADALRDFSSSSSHRLFLAELLASYTKVVSGSTWVRTSRGWRRRRFSELDLMRLAELLDVVPEIERAAVWRRMGDLALFLTGVFPDHSELHALSPPEEQRLLRRSGVSNPERSDGPGSSTGAVSILEELGARWYAIAARSARGPLASMMTVVGEVAQQFGAARRTLNYLTDRYLFPQRTMLFGDLKG